ncbi:MAG: protein translocase subunit SecD, partial [Pseudomonadales bacterium]|nr:protein translocase subunit SecD [Pseudomonadales bacterium]
MARSSGLVGERLLGGPRQSHRPPNTHSIARYLFVFFVIVMGCIFAAPNLYQPDPALQIRAIDKDSVVTQAELDRAIDTLASAGIETKATELLDGSAVVRVFDDEAQLRGRDIVQAALNKDADEFVVALNRASTTPQWLQDLGGKPMSLGLDLSGGVHFMLQVDMDKFTADRLRSNQETARDAMREQRLRYVPGNWVSGSSLNVPFQSASARDQAAELLGSRLEGFAFESRSEGGQEILRMTMTEERIRELEDLAISQNLQSLRNRVNELGVSEPLVQSLGRERIVLDLPGIQDSARAKEIINKFANLEFRIMALPNTRAAETETYPHEGSTVRLMRRSIVTGDQVTNAQQDFDPESGQPQVSITLDNDGGRAM